MARVWNPDQWLLDVKLFLQLHHTDVVKFNAVTKSDFPDFEYVQDNYCIFINDYSGLITTFKSERFHHIDVYMSDGTVKTFMNPNLEQ